MEARIEQETSRAQAMDNGDSDNDGNDQVKSSTRSIVGCPEDSKMMYRIPYEKNMLKLRQIDSDDDAIDVACIDKKYEKVDVYDIYEFHIRDVNSNTDLGAVTVEEIQLEDDNLYVDITFDDINLVDFEEIPFHVKQMMEHVKSKNEKTEPAEHGGNDDDDDDDDDVHLDSSTAESFHDSDYDFRHVDEDVIFQSCVVTPKQELGGRIGKIQPDGEGKSRGKECNKQKMSLPATKKKKDEAKDNYFKDLHLDEGDQSMRNLIHLPQMS
ncbi:uncharacterized protein LOC113759398 [Coffea eugenioides]|uniref:uncharacterized protein LOC113759398 n=1 Tax=Coffea eugenioides TaxID=49369 RepID=UPI000F61237A|nr:uncharacterized protein LOC113759398 [Coffea eugenioides]